MTMTTESYCGFDSAAALDADTKRLFAEAMFVGNGNLPEKYHGSKEKSNIDIPGHNRDTRIRNVYGRSLLGVSKQYDRTEKRANVKKEIKAERERRVALYKNQVDTDGQITFDSPHEVMQDAAEQSFCSANGLMSWIDDD